MALKFMNPRGFALSAAKNTIRKIAAELTFALYAALTCESIMEVKRWICS